MKMKTQVNTGALIASPQLTDEWVDCEIKAINTVGQYWVFPAPSSGWKFHPLYVFPNQVREVYSND